MKEHEIMRRHGSWQTYKTIHDAPQTIGNITRIGTRKEKSTDGNKNKWFRLEKQNRIARGYFINDIEIELEREIKRLIANLDIHHNGEFIQQVYYVGLQFYKQMPFKQRIRSPYVLAPLAVYITCLRRFIFIKIGNLYDKIQCKRSFFRRGLIEIYKNNDQLYSEIRSDKFRKKYIYGILIGVKNHFKFRDDFLSIGKALLEEYYEDFKNHKDTVIALFISVLIRRFFNNNLSDSNTKVSEYLGVALSVLNNNKKFKEVIG